MYSLARTTALAVAMMVAAASAATARSSPFQASQTKDLPCSISGRVTIGGVPARGVAVLLTSSERGLLARPLAKATTDQDGRFQLTGVPAGQHQLYTFAPALVGLGADVWRPGKVINVFAGESIEGEDIALIRGAVITGRVTDADGQPVIQEYVRVYLRDEQGRKAPIYLPFGSTFSQATTDDRGVYRLFGVPPGRYILAVGADSGAPIGRMASGNTYYPLTYHPDVTDEAKATSVEAAAGTEATGVDIVLGRASRAYSASGRIIDADTGKAIVAMQFAFSSLSPEGRQVYSTSSGSTSGARGEFRIDGLAPGAYSAFAIPNPDNDVYSDLAPFTVNGNDVAGLEIKVRRGSSIIGNVIIEGAEGQQTAPRPSDVRVGISSGSLNVAPRSGQLSIAPDGSFRAIGLPRGIANFSVFTYPGNKGLSLLRVERDGVEQKNGIEIGLAEEITGVKVVVAHGTGAIRGRVQMESGEIPAGAMMFISLRRIGAVLHQNGMPPVPDSRGRFAIDALPSGEYELSLTFQARPVAGSPQMNAKSLKQTVTVKNGAETQVTMIVDLSEKNQ